MPRILNNADLNGNQLLSARLHMVITGSIPTPSGTTEARIGYDSSLDLPWWLSPTAVNYIYPSATANTANTTVLRDGSGNFSAGTITATLSGNASTASQWQTSRTITLSGAVTGSASINGSANVTITTTVGSGGITPGGISLTNGNILVGNGSGVAADVNPNTVALSRFGAAAADLNLGGFKFLNSAAITSSDAASTLATKGYVDSVAQGLDPKPSVRAATVGSNITRSGTMTLDGVVLVVGDTVLVKDQTAPEQNGIFIVNAGAWTRAEYADVWDELVSAYVWVEEGTVNADTGWVCTVNRGYYTIDVHANTWVQFSSAAGYLAGRGMNIQGTTINFGTANVDYATNSVPYATGATTIGFTNVGAQHSVLVAGVAGAPAFGSINLASSAAVGSTILNLANGGTNAAITASAGGIVYSTSSALTVLAGAGVANKVLLSGVSVPAWSTATYPATAGTAGTFIRSDGTNWGNSTLVLPNAISTNQLLVGTSTNTVGALATANNAALITNGSGVPVLSAATSNQVLRADGSGNVAWGAVNLASGSAVTGTLTVSNGGTGNFSMTQYGVLYGDGTASVKSVAVVSGSRQFLTQASTTAPAFFDLFATANTWTASQTFNPGTTQADALVIDIAALGSAGSRDSHYFLMTGRSYDTVTHRVDWRQFVDVLSNSGALSYWTLQARVDSNSFASVLTVSSEGDIEFTSNKTTSSTQYLVGNSTAGGVSLLIRPGDSTAVVRSHLYLLGSVGPTGSDQGGSVYVCGGNASAIFGYVYLGYDGTSATPMGTVRIPSLVNGRPLWCSDALGGIYSYDLFGSANTWTGVQTLTAPKIITGLYDTNGNMMLAFSVVASSVNYLQIQNGIAGTPGVVRLEAEGASANINVTVAAKGTGVVRIGSTTYPSTLSANQYLISNATPNVVTGLSNGSSWGVAAFGSGGTPTALVASTDGHVLRFSGSTLAFGALNLASGNAVTGILPSANGGTGSAFFAIAGPTVLRTFTLPNMDATLAQKKTFAIPATGAQLTIAHGMATADIVAQVVVSTSPGSGETTGDVVYPDIRVDATNVVVTFSFTPAANQYKLICVG